MADLQAIVAELRDTLVSELGDDLRALYLFGPAARGVYVPGRSDVDLLLLVAPEMPLALAREAFYPLWERHAARLGHGPLLATPDDLALHLALFPALHRDLSDGAWRLYGAPLLKSLAPPPPPDPIAAAANLAARAVAYAPALTPQSLSPQRAQRLAVLLDQLARGAEKGGASALLTPVEATLALHARLRELAQEMPQFEWHGPPPGGEVPDLLPGCLAFYQRENQLIAVLERVDEDVLSGVDWQEVGAAAEDAYAQFGLATPWQLRVAASRTWADSLFFKGFEHMWGADILGDLEVDERMLLRQLARVASTQRVEALPGDYLTCQEDAFPKLIHDTQNVLLNAGLRAELFARLAGRAFDLSDWTPPGREMPQHERVAADWARWREMTVYYADMWRAHPGHE